MHAVARTRRRSLLRLRPLPTAARAARAAIDDLLADDTLHAVRFKVRLLATELVTNSVQHAGLAPEDELELRVELFADHIRVDVIDEGRWRRESALSTDARPHHGLLLLGALADRWGVAKNATTRVWFEIDF